MKGSSIRRTCGLVVAATGLMLAMEAAPTTAGPVIALPAQVRTQIEKYLGKGIVGQAIPAPTIDDPAGFLGLGEQRVLQIRVVHGKMAGQTRNRPISLMGELHRPCRCPLHATTWRLLPCPNCEILRGRPRKPTDSLPRRTARQYRTWRQPSRRTSWRLHTSNRLSGCSRKAARSLGITPTRSQRPPVRARAGPSAVASGGRAGQGFHRGTLRPRTAHHPRCSAPTPA